MSYLARLKGMNSEKCPPSPLQKLQEPPFYSFCSTQGGRFQKITPLIQPVDEAAHAPAPDPARAARFAAALALLAETPGRQVALVTDLDAEPGFVLVTLAFQGRGLIELAILDARYDGADLLRRFLAHYGDGPPGPGGTEQ